MRKKLLFIAIASLIAVLGICLYGCERMHTPDDSKLQNESEIGKKVVRGIFGSFLK